MGYIVQQFHQDASGQMCMHTELYYTILLYYAFMLCTNCVRSSLGACIFSLAACVFRLKLHMLHAESVRFALRCGFVVWNAELLCMLDSMEQIKKHTERALKCKYNMNTTDGRAYVFYSNKLLVIFGPCLSRIFYLDRYIQTI